MSWVPEYERCLYGKCVRRGERHVWGFGFLFCDIHMPCVDDMANDRPIRVPVGQQAHPGQRQCRLCSMWSTNRCKGLCPTCHSIMYGDEDKPAPASTLKLKQKDMYGDCLRCDHDSQLNGRGLCHACYTRLWRQGALDKYPKLKKSKASAT